MPRCARSRPRARLGPPPQRSCRRGSRPPWAGTLPRPMGALDQARLRELVTRLAAIDRPSASEGERRAALIVAEELRAAGCRVSVEEERVHGTYWWPLGLL